MARENKLQITADLILVMLMSSSIGQALYTSLFMTKAFSSLIFLVVIPLTLLLFLMFRNKLSSLISLISVVVILAAGFTVIILKIGSDNVLLWLNRYSIWFIDITNGYKDVLTPYYSNITIAAIAFLVTLFVFIFSIKFYNFYLTTVLFFSIFFIQLQFNVSGSDYAFILFIFSFLLYYFFFILKRRNKEKTYNLGNNLKYLVYILPVCIMVLAFTFLFPLKQERFSIPWLDTRIDKSINKIVNKFSGVDVSSFDYFSFGISGFGKSDRLGGNLNLSQKIHVMDVETDHSNLYLRASSKANYDGHRWYSDENNFSSLGLAKVYNKQINSDTSKFVNTISSALGPYIVTYDSIKNDYNDYYADSKAVIKFVNMKTKSIFIPVKTHDLKFKATKELVRDNEQMLSTNELLRNGFSYSFEYYNLNLKSEKLINLLRKSHTGGKKIPASTKTDTVDSFYTKYTQLPETITPRVRALAQEITKYEKNTYDKAKAIETYLSKNYPYTLAPGTPPRSRDFVDYFLFEGKEGYCTYYASAMTIMLRCLDIPSRYVEGYILPPEREDAVFKVTSQQAHAWVEVYFDDFGWIPFEPTAPFVANLYDDRTISATASSEMLQDTSYQEYMEMMDRYRNGGAAISYNFDTDASNDSGINKPILILIIISSILGLIVLALCSFASINYFKFYNLQRKIKKGSPNSSILIAYNYILKALKFQGISIIPGETPTQFGERVEKLLDIKSYSFNKTSFILISGYYVKARYSRNPLSGTEIEKTLEFINVLLDLMVEKSGKFKFGFSRYLLGKY